MGTSAVIRVEGFNAVEVYKHWDGYPESTLPWLEKFNKEFAAQRGDDPSYKFAQLLRSSAFDAAEFGLDESRHTGWGVFTKGSSYYNYLYVLKTDGSVVVTPEPESEDDDD